jgi:hypothetical protein
VSFVSISPSSNQIKSKIRPSRLLTKIRPVVVWPDISSPAQSLASVIKVPSNSCLPRLAFCSFCLGSLGESSGSLRQQMNAKARQRRTIRSPAKNVKMLDKRKHHHFRTIRQSSIGASVVINSSSQPDIPYQIVRGDLLLLFVFHFNHLGIFRRMMLAAGSRARLLSTWWHCRRV